MIDALCLSAALIFLIQGTTQAPRDPRPMTPSGTGILRGIVVDEPAGTPIAGARVMVNSANPSGAEFFAVEGTTGDDGRFELTGIPAGDLVVSANAGEHRASHLPTTMGNESQSPFTPRPSLRLAPGEVKADLRIALERALAIEGRVLDEHGEPMTDVSVSATAEAGGFGSAQGVTDDRGWFRVFGLAPGSYRVCAVPYTGRNMSDVPSEGDGLTTRYDKSCAAPHSLAAGREVPSVQIQLTRVGVFTLSGMVASSTGAAASEARVTVHRLSPDGIPGSVRAEMRNGVFVARGLMLGDYVVHARFHGRGLTDGRTVSESGIQSVQIDGTDVTGVTVTTRPVATVHGRLERDPRAMGPLPSRLTIWMIPPVEHRRLEASQPDPATTAPDGTFTMTGVFGPQVINVADPPDGWFVASVRHGNEDITDEAREFVPGDERPVVVVLSNRSAALRVRAMDERGNTKADAFVVLVPVDARRRGAPQVMLRQDADGIFHLEGRPGDFLVAALPVQDAVDFPRSSQTFESIARLGRRVTLVEGETVTIDVPITPLGGRR